MIGDCWTAKGRIRRKGKQSVYTDIHCSALNSQKRRLAVPGGGCAGRVVLDGLDAPVVILRTCVQKYNKVQKPWDCTEDRQTFYQR